MHDPLGLQTPIWEYDPSAWQAGVSMQGDVLARLDGLIGRQQPSADAPSPQAAFEKLLNGQNPYDLKGPPVSLAPFRMDRLSLPTSVHDCPSLESVLPDDALEYLRGYQERMLDGGVEATDVKTKVYFDPVLTINQKKYQQLVRMLIERGLVNCVEKAKERVGLFCVRKADGLKLRLIVDARRTNERFKVPPGVSLITGEGLSHFEVDADVEDTIPVEDELVATALSCSFSWVRRMYAIASIACVPRSGCGLTSACQRSRRRAWGWLGGR